MTLTGGKQGDKFWRWRVLQGSPFSLCKSLSEEKVLLDQHRPKDVQAEGS